MRERPQDMLVYNRHATNGMKEAMRRANREGWKGIEAEPVSIVGLGAAAFTSAAPAAPISIMTTTKRAAHAYLPALSILSHTHRKPATSSRYRKVQALNTDLGKLM